MLTLFSGRHLMHVRRLLALSLAVPVLLAGCSDDPEPTPRMPDSPSSSPTTEPTETETPEAESPEDFIRRWVKAGDEMQVTGETGEFRDMSRGCRACEDLIQNVRRIYADGGRIEFAGTRVARLNSVGDEPPTFELDLETPETRIVDDSGQTTQTYPSGIGKYLITLGQRGEDWRVTHYGRR